MYGGLLQVYGNVNRTVREEVFIQSLPVFTLLRELALPRVSPTSIGSTRHRFSTCRFPFSTLLSHGKSDEYIIFFLRNRGSENERVEEMPISEVRKPSIAYSSQ